MPTTNFQWLTFSDVDGMRNASAKVQIRAHANKEIARVRRYAPNKGRNGKGFLEFPLRKKTRARQRPTCSCKTHWPRENNQHSLSAAYSVCEMLDDKVLYNPYARGISGAFDPFGTTSVFVDSNVSGLLQYFVFYTSNFAKAWTYCPSSLPHEPLAYGKAIRAAVDSALHDKLMMHCLLSASSSRLYYSEGVWLPRWRRKELESTQQALVLLRERIEQRTKSSGSSDVASIEQLVSAVTHLSTSAFHKGDLETAKIHLHAALKLADSIGGFSALQDPHIQGRLLDRDNLISSAELEPTNIRCLHYDPGPASTNLPWMAMNDLYFEEKDDLAATGLLSSDDSTFLPEPLKSLIFDMVECHKLKVISRRMSTSLGSGPQSLSIRHFLTMRVLSIRSRLLSFPTFEPILAALRVVLIMYTLLPTSKDLRKHARCIQSLAPKLQAVLSSQQYWVQGRNPVGQFRERCAEVRFWMLLLGCFCSADPSETHDWFAGEIQKESRKRGFMSVHGQVKEDERSRLITALISIQKRFFWDEEVMMLATERLVDFMLGAALSSL